MDRRTDSFGLSQNADALTQILEQMRAAAEVYAQMSTQRDAYSGIGPIAANLASRLDALTSLVRKIEWALFRPVVHYLDWRLRMMPVLPPQDIFVLHAKEYRTAATLLRDANALWKGALGGNRD